MSTKKVKSVRVKKLPQKGGRAAIGRGKAAWDGDIGALLRFARAVAKARGYRLSASFEVLFFRLASDRDAADDASHSADEARTASGRLIEAVIGSGPGKEGSVLNASSLKNALEGVCPLWPFCR